MDPDPAVVLVLQPGMTAAARARVYADVAEAAAQRRGVVCQVYGGDLSVVDVLARVELLSRRLGVRCRLRASSPGVLREVLELAGLREVLGGGLEVLGEPEPAEQ